MPPKALLELQTPGQKAAKGIEEPLNAINFSFMRMLIAEIKGSRRFAVGRSSAINEQ